MRDHDADGGQATRAGIGPITRASARPRLPAGLADLAAGRADLALRLAEAGRRLRDAVRDELDGGLALPALVVLFAYGIVAYFHLPREPWLPAPIALAGVTLVVTVARRRAGHPARLAAALTALALGVAAGAVETARVAAPRLDHERTVTVTGRVVGLDATEKGGLRLTVDVDRMEGRGLTPETTPIRITATVNARGWRPDVGHGVRFRARLKPPEGPVLPGGYDFARKAWFERRGAGGYVLGRVERIDLGPPDLATRLLAPVGSLRHTIAERVRAALPGATGAIGAALIVGEQRAIPESAAEPLRASGLTHIVSISGLHMSLVAGGVIVAIRALLALFPALALGWPIRKWAAAAAFVAATVYLLLSGMQVAALRSHLMLSVALLAVMVDRPAITMHTVAVSAALILAVDPSSVMDPSFQMSYLAVIALVACYDLYRAWAAKRSPPAREDGLIGHLVGATLRHFEGFAVSSLIAGLATAPVIAAVFFRAAPYSIFANMAVLPVTGLVVMPAAVVAVLAMPFGLDPWPLAAMGLGIDWMVAVGGWAAALPGGAGVIGASHPAMMPLGIAAVLWISAWRSRIRLFGLVPAVAAVLLVFLGSRPDVMIGRHGSPIAVRGDDGRLHVLATRQDRFDTAIWLAADADPRDPAAPSLAEGWTCDPLGCVFALPATPDAIVSGAGGTSRSAADPAVAAATGPGADGTAATFAAPPYPTEADALRPRLEIAVVRHPDGFAEDCRRAALVITTLIAPPGCRDHTTVVDRIDLARTGASSLTFTGPTEPVGRRGVRADGVSAPLRPPSLPAVDPTSDADERTAEDPTGDAHDEDRHAASPSSTVRGPGAPDDDETEIDPPTLRRAVAITSALPRPPRPWTPIDPRIDRLAREAEEAEAFAADARHADPPLSSGE